MNQQDYLKAICNYLPYGVEVYNEKANKVVGLTPSNFQYHLDKKSKLLLTPLSEITKEIEVNGEKFNPNIELQRLFDNCYSRIDIATFCRDITINFKLGRLDFQIVEKLLKWRFDIFGLIEKGYALDKTKLK